jgi:arylsulfatase A-like enzyme
LGDFIDRLDAAGHLENALVIVTSDHGESFDHGFLGHSGPRLHDVLLRIPFVIKLPGQRSARTVDQPTSQADVAPTVVDVAAAPPMADIEGRSLRPLLMGGAIAAMPVYAMSMEHQSRFKPLNEGRYAVIDGSHKLVWDRKRDLLELYDLKADPLERTNLSVTHVDRVQRLQALLKTRLADAEVRRRRMFGD